MANKSRDSGHRSEKEVRDLLKPLWPQARRGLGQAYGAQQCDVEGTPFRIEVKCHARWPPVEAALTQVARDAQKYGDERPQIVIHKKKNGPGWRVTMTIGEFFRIVDGGSNG